jgi:hypothetical protein
VALVPPALAQTTGDSRTVTEPVFRTVRTQLSAAITEVSDDITGSVDATITNPDGARIQAALNSCSTNNPGEAVELSIDGTGVYKAFLTGPLSMPRNVTLLVDPGFTVFFSRNAQDYNKTPGQNTYGAISGGSATSSCLPPIDISRTSTNVGIMGYGKLHARGGDPPINGFATTGYTAPSAYSWWTLAAQADLDSGGNQENPILMQPESDASKITLYKITLLNSPMFHVKSAGTVSDFTAWDIKIVTPLGAQYDVIDPDPGAELHGYQFVDLRWRRRHRSRRQRLTPWPRDFWQATAFVPAAPSATTFLRMPPAASPGTHRAVSRDPARGPFHPLPAKLRSASVAAPSFPALPPTWPRDR